MSYWQLIRIRGVTSENPELEICEGLGGGGAEDPGCAGSAENPIMITASIPEPEIPRFDAETEAKLETYVSDAVTWLTSALESLQTGIEQYNAGEPVTVTEPDPPPDLDVSIAFDWGAAVDVVLWMAKIAFRLLLWWAYNWFVERIRRLKDGKPAEIPEEIATAIKDLSLVDAIIDFGGFKVHTVGKAIEK